MSPETRKLFDELMVRTPTVPAPKVRLSIDANIATPAIAALIARVLVNAGASVSFGDKRSKEDFVKTPEQSQSLDGLRVHIGQLTWVRDEEAQRWGE